MHNDGQTSYQQRWGKDRKSPLCELGETVRYQLRTIRVLPNWNTDSGWTTSNEHADSSATATTVADSSSAVHNQWCPRNRAQQQHHQWQHHHQQFHDKHYQCHYSILATGEAESKQARTQQEPKAKERVQEHTRTKGDKTKDRRSHNYNKERREDYSSIKRRQRRD